MKAVARKDAKFGEKISLKQLHPFRDYAVECLGLNEREAKLCTFLNIKTLSNLAETPVSKALAIRNLWYRSVQSLMEKLSQFVTNWHEIERDFLNTPFTEILQKLTRYIPEKERIFFVRRYFYGEMLSEIGRDYEMTREGVRQKLLKAQRSLQTPNWEKLVEQYVERHLVPLFKDNKGNFLPKREIKKQIKTSFKGVLPVACATFVLLEQLYFSRKQTESAKAVRICRKLLEKMIKRPFDTRYRRACRQGKIGKKIRVLRRLQEWTQTDLARRLKCTQVTVNRWEKGKFIPRRKNIEKIAQIFGLSKEALLLWQLKSG